MWKKIVKPKPSLRAVWRRPYIGNNIIFLYNIIRMSEITNQNVKVSSCSFRCCAGRFLSLSIQGAIIIIRTVTGGRGGTDGDIMEEYTTYHPYKSRIGKDTIIIIIIIFVFKFTRWKYYVTHSYTLFDYTVYPKMAVGFVPIGYKYKVPPPFDGI